MPIAQKRPSNQKQHIYVVQVKVIKQLLRILIVSTLNHIASLQPLRKLFYRFCLSDPDLGCQSPAAFL